MASDDLIEGFFGKCVSGLVGGGEGLGPTSEVFDEDENVLVAAARGGAEGTVEVHVDTTPGVTDLSSVHLTSRATMRVPGRWRTWTVYD